MKTNIGKYIPRYSFMHSKLSVQHCCSLCARAQKVAHFIMIENDNAAELAQRRKVEAFIGKSWLPPAEY